MKPKIEDLLNQLPKEVSVEQHYHDEQQKLIHNEEMKFTFGDKLEALDWHKEEHGIEYVTITGINQQTQVYYWEADLNWELGGKLSSGYYFKDAIAYKPKQTAREYNSPILQELLDEITPEEMEKTNKEMELLDFASWILKHYHIKDEGGFHYVNSMGEYTPTYKLIQHYLEDEQQYTK